MSIKIVTMNSSYNYGAVLQAYALQQTLLKLDFKSEFIDQRLIFKLKYWLFYSPACHFPPRYWAACQAHVP